MKEPIRVVALSDLHGTLPPSSKFPKCDLVLIAGDICGSSVCLDQSIWLHKEFKPWLENLPCDQVIGIAGNHDFIWEKSPHLVPKLPWTYLQDSGCEYKGWKIYGTPWQPRFYDWAFNMDEPDLEKRWALIPDDTDILITHGPPQGYGDEVLRMFGNERQPNVGSPSLTQRIKAVRPRLSVFGHIHPGFGVFDCNGSVLANVSILDDNYSWIHQPTEFLIEPTKTTARIRLRVNNKDDKTAERVIEWGELAASE